MNRKIFINLSVKDLISSVSFFESLGFIKNPQFSDDTAACIVISEEIYVMVLTEPKFKQFTKKDISDAHKTTEVLLALSCESREEVDSLVSRAVAGGGRIYAEPQDHGFMYQHSFEDLDGHQWELVYMDMNSMPPQE